MRSSQSHTSVPLASFKAKAGSHVIVLYTREQGQVRASFRRSRGRKKPSASLLSLFSTYQILLEEPKGGGELHQVTEYETVTARPRLNSSESILAWSAAHVLDEFLLKTTHGQGQDEYLFAMLEKGLDSLESGAPPRILLIAFLLKALEHLGYGPRFEECSCGKSISPKDSFVVSRGGATCSSCLLKTAAGPLPNGRRERFLLPLSDRKTLRHLRVARFESLDEEGLGEETIRRWIALLDAYVSFHLEIRLRSFEFLEQIQKPSLRRESSPHGQ